MLSAACRELLTIRAGEANIPICVHNIPGRGICLALRRDSPHFWSSGSSLGTQLQSGGLLKDELAGCARPTHFACLRSITVFMSRCISCFLVYCNEQLLYDIIACAVSPACTFQGGYNVVFTRRETVAMDSLMCSTPAAVGELRVLCWSRIQVSRNLVNDSHAPKAEHDCKKG